MQPEEFIAVLFPSLQDDEAVCFARKQERGWIQQPKPFTDPGPDYYGVSSVVRPERALRVRRRKKDLKRAHVVVLDDVGTKGKEPPVEPTYVMETSKDNYQWGYAIEPEEDVAYFEACMKAMGDAGYADPGTLDAGRVMRTPDSINDKEGRNNFRSRITLWNPEKRWKLPDLMRELGLTPSERGRFRDSEAHPLPGGLFVRDALLEFFASRKMVLSDLSPDGWVHIECPWGHLHDSDPRPDAKYSPLGCGDKPEIRGFKCFHGHFGIEFTGADLCKWAGQQGGPKVRATDRHAIDNAVLEHTLRQAPKKPNGEMPAWYRKAREIEAMPDDDQPDKITKLAAQYAYCAMDDLYYRLDCGEVVFVKPQAMPRLYTDPIDTLTPAGTPTTKPLGTVAMRDVTKMEMLDFRPDRDILFREQGVTRLNSFRPPAYLPAQYNTRAFYSLIERIAVLEEERAFLLRWLAYKLQNPEVRGPTVLSMSVTKGVRQNQGSGRGTLIRCLRALYGEKYVTELSFETLAGKTTQSQYTDWMHETLWAVISEAKDTSTEHLTRRNARVSAYERVKELAEPGVTRRQIVRKGLPNVDRNVYTSLLIASNHRDVMEIPEDDRRIFVCQSAPSDTADDRYWNWIHSEMDNDAFVRALYYELHEMDVSDFNPYAHAPLTPTKLALFAETENEATQLVLEFIEWLPSDFVVPTHVRGIWQRFVTANPDVNDLPEHILVAELRKLGARPDPENPQRRFRVRDKFYRPLVVKNVPQWQRRRGQETFHHDVSVELAKNWDTGLKIVPPSDDDDTENDD